MHYWSHVNVRRRSLNSTILLNDQQISLETHWRDMSSQLREFKRFSRYGFVGASWMFGQSIYSLYSRGLWSFRDKVVSIQVKSLQIEVVSRHYQSHFDTCRKSIQFNSIFRGKVEFCLLKWTAVNGSYSLQVLSIIIRLYTVVILCNFELCKGKNCIFALPKTTNSFKISACFSLK